MVQAVDRALALIEHLAEAEEGARLSDAARAVGLAPSTAHRLLTTMEQRGFVQFAAATGRWYVGRRAFAVGAAFSRRENLVAPALPILRRLRDATRETANLGVIEDGVVRTVAQVESREIMRAIASPGGRTPVGCSGMGKAIVAAWPDAAIEALVARHGLAPKTPRSLTTPAALMAEIARVRAQGYAVDDEEFVAGMRCVAAVVRDAGGEPVCAVSISGLAARVTQASVPELAQVVRRAAEALTEALAGRADGQQKGPATPHG
ncbi:IclR family transcriptional regulator [Frigidibacter sp. MR17.24]|uniref:IclR family transcriptional regulator n=1 Tax=Frigidibacter sp. MR17.24 TaxID=3127345 RepID=UPI003012AEF4